MRTWLATYHTICYIFRIPPTGADTGLWSYLKDELTRGYLAKGDDKMYTERQRRMDTFMQTPRQLEKVGHTHTLCNNFCPAALSFDALYVSNSMSRDGLVERCVLKD